MSIYIPEIKEEISENAKMLVEDGGKIVRTMIPKNEDGDPRLHIGVCQDVNTGEYKLSLFEQSPAPMFAWKKITANELLDKLNAQGKFPQITLSHVYCSSLDIDDFINDLRNEGYDDEFLEFFGIESFEVFDGYVLTENTDNYDIAYAYVDQGDNYTEIMLRGMALFVIGANPTPRMIMVNIGWNDVGEEIIEASLNELDGEWNQLGGAPQ